MNRFVRSFAFATAALLVASTSCNDQPTAPKYGRAERLQGRESNVVVDFVRFDFTGNTGSEVTAPATTVAPGITAGPFTRGSGLTTSAAANAFSSASWTLATSADPTDYVEFSVTPQAGSPVTITDFSFSEQRSGTGPVSWSAQLVLFDGTTVALGSGATVTALGPHSLTIPAAAQGPHANTFKIRLFAFGATGSAGTWRQDNVLLRGEGGGVTPTVDHVTVAPTSATVTAGNPQQFTATAFDVSNNAIPGTAFNWSLNPPTGVATVSASGLVTATAAGDVTVTATASNAVAGSATLHVNPTSFTDYSGQLVISQVYGGGGNSGATFKNDFIEIFNRGTNPVSVNGWSVQYSSAGGTSWQSTPISGTIPPGAYYLVAEASGGTPGTDLPPSNATGTINLSGTSGKVLLAQQTTAFAVACPTGNAVVDIASYGSGTNCGNPAPTLSNTSAATRKVFGCTWTSNPALDFAELTPAPRNAASPTHSCAVGALDHVTISGTLSLVTGGTTQLTAAAFDANDNPVPGATFTWTTGDASIATVNGTGLVTGVAANADPAIITASAAANSVTKDAAVSVMVNNPGGINWIDVFTFFVTSFPPGFEGPISVTARDANGGTEIPSTITAEAVEPQYVSISMVGNIILVKGVSTPPAGVKPGIRITATPIGGGTPYTFTAHPFTETQGTSASPSIYGNNDAFGDPSPAGTDPNDFLIRRNQHVLSYNQSRGTPNWVSYELDARQTGASDRCNCFTADPNLPVDKRIYTFDYTSGGYDRGHMQPSADRTAASLDNAATFYLTNVVPQKADLNQGVWEHLEAALRDSVDAGRAVYVIVGPIYSPSHPLVFLNNAGKVAIPDSTWKVALIGPANGGNPFTNANVQSFDDLVGLTILAVNMPNIDGVRNADWMDYRTKVDKIEASTGLNILSILGAGMQGALDYKDHKPVAAFSVSGTPNEGSSLTFDASASSDVDFGRTDLGLTEALTYSWTFSDGTQAIGKVVTHAFGNDGNQSATLTVTDAWGWPATTASSVAIANVAPVITPLSSGSLALPANYSATGSFTDPGSDTWSGTVNYGDGSPVQPLAISGHTFSLSHSYTTFGAYTVSVSVSDGVATATGSASVTVKSRPVAVANGPYSSNEGSSLTLSGAGSSDPDGAVVSYAWNFGDGSTGAGSNVSHTYAQDGSFTVTLLVTDNDGLTGVVTSTATVANVAPTIAPFSSATLPIGNTYSANGSFSDPGADAWTATVNYGDGSGAQALALSGGTFALSHTYAAAGAFTVTVTVSDDNATTSRTASVTVLAYPVASAGGPYSGSEGGSVSLSGAASSDADGTIASYAWNFGDGSTGSGASTAHTYAQDGSFTVTLTVTDNDGLTNTTTATATIANVAPFVSAFAGATILNHTMYSAAGTFSDPGADACSATVDYGDSTGEHLLTLAGGGFALSHTYNSAGTFTVTVRVSDDDVTTTQTAIVVVLTAQQSLANISAAIDQLGLNNGNANSLKAKINAAIAQLDKGNTTPARNQLQALLNEINAKEQSGVLSGTDAAALRSAVLAVLGAL